MIRLLSRFLFLLLLADDINASPLASMMTRQSDTTMDAHVVDTLDAPTAWSNEAIFTLVGVCVAILGILIGLLSSPKLRQWLCQPLKCKQSCPLLQLLVSLLADIHVLHKDFSKRRRLERLRVRADARQNLQQQYNEYLRFNEFLEMRGEASGASRPW
jgi:uncharacterized membrane protein YcjF (UPF0283 family)